MKILLLSSFMLLCSIGFSAEPYYHSVKAKNGDGIFSLLRRYHLNTHHCNRDRFLELNALSLRDELMSGKEYKLPIKIFEYNGKSIRTTVGIDDLDQAIRIKKYNEQIYTEKLRQTHFLDSKILWVPFHEFNCVDAVRKPAKLENKKSTIPTTIVPASTTPISKTPAPKAKRGNYKVFPVFGKSYESVEIKSKALNNEVYYIVSGHGGPDPGAPCADCSTTICEDEYAYDVALRLSKELISKGATVHIIIKDKNDGIRNTEILKCDQDERCNGMRLPLRQKARLNQRASAINHLYKSYKKKGVKKQLAIMVHVDSYADKNKRVDAYFIHHKSSRSSKKLAQSLQKTFKAKYNEHQKGRGYNGIIKERGLYMLNYTLPTAVFVELGNINNRKDRTRILKPGNRQALAEWLAEGMINYK